MLVEGLSRECLEDVDTSETLRLQRSNFDSSQGCQGHTTDRSSDTEACKALELVGSKKM